MIEFEKFQLSNGLRVVFHKDETTPIAVVNIIYDVGARDEDPDRTGFAHLFEHLMFGGSKHIENFDAPLQLAGGECNAFTNNDITNYYDTLPVQNIETALWLESDRMLELAFTPKSLEVQRNVVVEEFKQRYLNQPYGDVWLELRPLIYKSHPYQWPTIGKKIEHITSAKLQDVKDFFFKHYGPQNAVLVIGGNLELSHIKEVVEKWFGEIPSREKVHRNIPPEPPQKEERRKEIERDVPSNSTYMAFRMGNRLSMDYYYGDLCSDILSGGKSSRLYSELVVKQRLFTSISAYITGSWEDGLFVVSGHMEDGISFEKAEKAIWEQLNQISMVMIEERELTKVKNKFRTSKVFSEQSLMNRVMNIAMFEMLGQLDELNSELEKYSKITAEDLLQFAAKTFVRTNQCVLQIRKKNG